MKRYLAILAIFILSSCDKSETNKNEFVDITYELQTNATGFSLLRYGNFYELSNGFSGIQMENWTVSGTGNFTKTVSIRKGYLADAVGIHATSGDWSLKIKSSTGNVIASGTPGFIPDSNYYYLRINTPAQ